jgi:hypothetical protein
LLRSGMRMFARSDTHQVSKSVGIVILCGRAAK